MGQPVANPTPPPPRRPSSATRASCSEVAALVAGCPHTTCLIHVVLDGRATGSDTAAAPTTTTTTTTTSRHIVGSVRLCLDARDGRPAPRDASGLEAATRAEDRILLRHREFCTSVVVYASNETEGETERARHAVGRVCHLLGRDPHTPPGSVRYLSCFRKFAAAFPALMEGGAAAAAPAAATMLPSMEERRRLAQVAVFRGGMCCGAAEWAQPPARVCEGVLLGGAQNAADVQGLQAEGVRLVVNVSSEVPDVRPDLFEYVGVAAPDHPDEAAWLGSQLASLCRRIGEVVDEGGSVLIHCLIGMSRSAAVAAGTASNSPFVFF